MSISTPGSRHSIERGVRPQNDAEELLAEIGSPGSAAKPRLLFNRREPTSTWDRFVGWLTRPIQRIQAKARIAEILKGLGLEKKNSEISKPVFRLKAELASAGVFDGISMKTARDAFIDLMINGEKPFGEFDTVFEQHLDQVKHQYEEKVGKDLEKTHGSTPALPAIRASVMKGLYVLLEFAKNPGCSLSKKEIASAREFTEKYAAKGDYEDQIATIFERYVDTFKIQEKLGSKSRIVELNDHAPPTPLQRKTIEDALDKLQAIFRPAEQTCIAAFKQFITGDFDLKTGEKRQSLHEFLERFPLKYLKLDRETQKILRPLVIRAEDALLEAQTKPPSEQQKSSSQHLVDGNNWPEIVHPAWQALADEFASNTGTASRFSPACSIALIEYLTIRDRIHTLETDNQPHEKQIATVKATVGKKLEAQQLKRTRRQIRRSSKVQHAPTRKAKAEVRRHIESAKPAEEAYRINAKKIASLKQQLVNPESMIRLAHVYESREDLIKSMQTEKLDDTLKSVLDMLYKDLKVFMEARIPRN